jgi:4-amino-4-deoxy-L-arabinose transferase-like glycosyltransferase
MNGKKELYVQLLIVGFGAALFVPFLGMVHLFDWDEINFAEAAREMLATNNFLQVQINFQPFWEKPPLFFWLQSLSMSLFGVNEFAARFVNAFAGICTLLIVYRIARKTFDRRFGLLWAGCLAGSFLPHLFYKSGIIDPVFNLFIFLGVYYLFKSENADSAKQAVLRCVSAGAFIGLATLTKGPVALLVTVLCAAAYWVWGRFRRVFALPGIAVFFIAAAAVSLLWYGVETLLHVPWFVTEFVKYQIRLFSTGDAGHGRPFWFHAVVLLFGVFPASFMAVRSFFPVKAGGETQSQRQESLTRWMVALFWVVLILFSIVKTKTVLYSSLCYFPITFLAAHHMHAVLDGRRGWNRWLTASLAGFGLLVAAIITLFPVVMRHTGWLMPLIQDQFARECLKNPVHWSYLECLIGLSYAAALVVAAVKIGRAHV